MDRSRESPPHSTESRFARPLNESFATESGPKRALIEWLSPIAILSVHAPASGHAGGGDGGPDSCSGRARSGGLKLANLVRQIAQQERQGHADPHHGFTVA